MSWMLSKIILAFVERIVENNVPNAKKAAVFCLLLEQELKNCKELFGTENKKFTKLVNCDLSLALEAQTPHDSRML